MGGGIILIEDESVGGGAEGFLVYILQDLYLQ
jgi:hypothetical protein